MTGFGLTSVGGALPPELRKASKDEQAAYRAAQGFERMLVRQLVATLDKGAFGDGPYADLLPGALADGLVDGGGLGIADQIYRGLAKPEEHA
jgi:Rod binding domain-containing protein